MLRNLLLFVRYPARPPFPLFFRLTACAVSSVAEHYANASNPSVPPALMDIVGAIGGLDDFLPEPDYTGPDGTHSLAPDDPATIYNFALLSQQGIDGTG